MPDDINQKVAEWARNIQYGDEEDAAKAMREMLEHRQQGGQGQPPAYPEDTVVQRNQDVRERIAESVHRQTLRESGRLSSYHDDDEDDEMLRRQRQQELMEEELLAEEDLRIEPTAENTSPDEIRRFMAENYGEILSDERRLDLLNRKVNRKLSAGAPQTLGLYIESAQEVEAVRRVAGERQRDDEHTLGIQELKAMRGQNPRDTYTPDKKPW